jgi:uncharacterized protein YccT (UPF0319 family)
MRGGLILLSLLLSLPVAAAELVVKEPLRVLAIMPQQSLTGSKTLELSPGEHQLLVRYEGVLPARSNSESDIEVNSEPQLLHIRVTGDESLTLSAPQLTSEAAMTQYVKTPAMTLTGSASAASSLSQQPVPLKGFVLGINYQDLLATKLRDDAATSVVAAAAFSASATTQTTAALASTGTPAAQSREQALQQLFLQATPEERKRFVSWAVQQF